MSHVDTQEMCERAFEHGQDEATEGRPYVPCLYGDFPPEVQAAYQKGHAEGDSK